MSKPTIYSLGTSTRTIEDFLGVLHRYHIETVVDVRSFPQSRFEHFIKGNLARILSERGLNYLHLGRELGGFRTGGYLSYSRSLAYYRGISRLERIAEEATTIFLCAERFPWRCHRRFIASSLEERGWHVVHIIDKNRVWRPKTDHGERGPSWTGLKRES